MLHASYQADKTLLGQYASAVVLGLGKTGYSVVRYLRKAGLTVAVADTRATPPYLSDIKRDHPEVETFLGDFDETTLARFPLIVLSPGLPLSMPALQLARQQGARIVGDIELFIEANTQPLIAITGSNGKSTVTTLVGEMCRAGGMQPWVAGNIGVPALDALTDQVTYDLAVLELSSFQLETTSTVGADAAAILNVSADHMDRYGSHGDYLLAKARILRGAKRGILPRHDNQLRQITNIGKPLSFGLDAPESDCEFGVKRDKKYRWLMKGDQRLIRLRDIPLLGLHNIENVLAAYALIDFLQLSAEKVKQAVLDFKGLPHRMQTVIQHQGVTWVNDSKATNIGATSTALQNLEQPIIWIAGGQGKGADFSALAKAITPKIKYLILFGEDALSIQSALTGLLPINLVDDMQQAVDFAAQLAVKGDVVLLSPACASFDMYKSFEHRGDDFTALVKARLGSTLEDDAA